MLDYTFQYGQIWPYLPRLIDGAYLALEIAFLSFCGGLLIGTANASLLSFGPKWVAKPIQAFVVFFTNTPQLVQIISSILHCPMQVFSCPLMRLS